MRLRFARAIVVAKIQGAKILLRCFASNHPRSIPSNVSKILDQQCQHAQDASSLETLRGIEGYAAKVYFQSLSFMNRSALPFNGRSLRPPNDPINAMLSLGYVLLCTELTNLLDAAGLDPYLGFYHEPTSSEGTNSKPALALDLLEPLRHLLIDRFCLSEANRRVFQPDDFEQRQAGKKTGIFLKPQAFKRFLSRYDAWMRQERASGKPSYRSLLQARVEKFRSILSNDRSFDPNLSSPQKHAGFLEKLQEDLSKLFDAASFFSDSSECKAEP